MKRRYMASNNAAIKIEIKKQGLCPKATVFKTPLVLKAKLRDFSIYKLEKSRFRIS